MSPMRLRQACTHEPSRADLSTSKESMTGLQALTASSSPLSPEKAYSDWAGGGGVSTLTFVLGMVSLPCKAIRWEQMNSVACLLEGFRSTDPGLTF